MFHYDLNSGSVSKIIVDLEIKGKTLVTCELKRHLSPRAVGTILRALPVEGNAHTLGTSILYFETMIDTGIERSRKEFKKGDIAFLPTGGSICFFMADSSPGKTMTPIGVVTSNVDELKNVKSGDVLKLYVHAET